MRLLKKVCSAVVVALCVVLLAGCAPLFGTSYTATVRYVDAATGEDIAEAYVRRVREGKPYDLSDKIKPDVEGYVYLKTLGPFNGDAIDADKEAVSSYKLDITDMTFTVTVSYRDWGTGEKVAEPVTLTQKGETAYDVSDSLVPDAGWYVVALEGEAAGTVQGDVEITSLVRPDLSGLGYDEYFSVRREFVSTNYRPVWDDKGLVTEIVTVPPEDTAADGSRLSFIYDHSDGVLTSQKIAVEYENKVFTRETVLYEPVIYDREVVFFLSQDSLMRLHIPSARLDTVYTAANSLSDKCRIFAFVPLSTTEVFFAVFNEQMTAYISMPDYSSDSIVDTPKAENPVYDLYVCDTADGRVYHLGNGLDSPVMKQARDSGLYKDYGMEFHAHYIFRAKPTLESIRGVYADVKGGAAS